MQLCYVPKLDFPGNQNCLYRMRPAATTCSDRTIVLEEGSGRAGLPLSSNAGDYLMLAERKVKAHISYSLSIGDCVYAIVAWCPDDLQETVHLPIFFLISF